MSILYIPSLFHCRTLEDWLYTLDSSPELLCTVPHRIFNKEQINNLLSILLHGMAPFYTCSVQFNQKIYLLSGGTELSIASAFIRSKIPVFTEQKTTYFTELSRSHRDIILSTKITSNDCRVSTQKEFNHLTEWLAKS